MVDLPAFLDVRQLLKTSDIQLLEHILQQLWDLASFEYVPRDRPFHPNYKEYLILLIKLLNQFQAELNQDAICQAEYLETTNKLIIRTISPILSPAPS
jgi:hypothetical protein